MAIKTISQFDAATPTSNDKILFEQNGEGKSATIGDAVSTCSLSYEEIVASTDLSGKVAGADSIRKAVINPGLTKIRRFFSATDSGTVALFQNVPYEFRISAILIGNGNGTLTFAYLTLFTFENTIGGDISGNYSIQGTKNEDGTVDISIDGVEPWGRYTLLVFYGY